MMRERKMPKNAYILSYEEALDRYHSTENPRDVWHAFTQKGAVWVESGPVTRTTEGRWLSEKKAKAAVQIQTGETVQRIKYDP